MTLRHRRDACDERPHSASLTHRRAKTVGWSLGIIVLLAGCAQAAATLPVGDALGESIAHTAFGHPTARPGGPDPTASGFPSTPGARPTSDPTGTPGPTGTPSPTGTPGPTPRPTPNPTPTPSPTPPPSGTAHVLVLMEENKGEAAVLSGAPFLDSLARTYASSSAWYGIDHPSAPNYVAILSGSIQGVVGDCGPPSCGPFNAPSLGGQLTGAHIPWTAYMESMPSPCYLGGTAGLYAEKHNPFVYFKDILDNGCTSHVLPYPGALGLVAALNGPSAPDFVWITPNLNDDMHDGTVLQGDVWAAANLAPVLASGWFRNYNSTVIVTMDEGDFDGNASCCGQPAGGPIPLIIISHAAVHVGVDAITGDQYGTLRSIEEAFGLPLLGAAANPINGDVRRLFG